VEGGREGENERKNIKVCNNPFVHIENSGSFSHSTGHNSFCKHIS